MEHHGTPWNIMEEHMMYSLFPYCSNRLDFKHIFVRS